MNTRRKREVKKIGQEYIKDHRGHKLIVPQDVIDRLKPESPLRDIFESPEELQHQAWLRKITDRVNRRLRNL